MRISGNTLSVSGVENLQRKSTTDTDAGSTSSSLKPGPPAAGDATGGQQSTQEKPVKRDGYARLVSGCHDFRPNN